MIVYLIRNTVNGKCYVGRTSRPLWHRWSQHKAEAKLERHDSPLYRDLRTYGPDAFLVVELASTSDSRRLAELERKFIREYNAVSNGYNLDGASHGPRKKYTRRSYRITPEHRARINASNEARRMAKQAPRRGWKGGCLMATHAPLVMRSENNYIRTYTGRRFWPLTPSAEDVCIEDIAHALSLQCRWTGHARRFYSVAEHSLRVSLLAQRIVMQDSPADKSWERLHTARETALWGLLHDSPEAYICDLARPVKHGTPLGDLYRPYEARLMNTIAAAFNLAPHMPAIVHEADGVLLATEARDLMGVPVEEKAEWGFRGLEQLTDRIEPMSPEAAEAEFLRRFKVLNMARTMEGALDKV